MRRTILSSIVGVIAAAALTAPAAMASGGPAAGAGGGAGGGADRCAAFPVHTVSAPSALDVSVSFTVTNCSQSKPELIDVDLALKNTAGQTLWISGTGYTQWLAPGQSMSGTFGGLGGFGSIVPGGTYDMQFIARDFVKADTLSTADTVFTVPAQ